jgi:hypothetical protein
LAAASSAECPDGRAALQLVAQPGGTLLSIITGKAICRGSFASVKELVAKIDHFVAKQELQTLQLDRYADSIPAKINRLCERISGTVL